MFNTLTKSVGPYLYNQLHGRNNQFHGRNNQFHRRPNQLHGRINQLMPRRAAVAAASAAASAAVRIHDVIIEGALRAPLYAHDKIHTAASAAKYIHT